MDNDLCTLRLGNLFVLLFLYEQPQFFLFDQVCFLVLVAVEQFFDFFLLSNVVKQTLKLVVVDKVVLVLVVGVVKLNQVFLFDVNVQFVQKHFDLLKVELPVVVHVHLHPQILEFLITVVFDYFGLGQVNKVLQAGDPHLHFIDT